MLVKAQIFGGDESVFDMIGQSVKLDERAVLAALERGDNVIVCVIDDAGLRNGGDAVKIKLLPGGNIKNEIARDEHHNGKRKTDEQEIAQDTLFLFAFIFLQQAFILFRLGLFPFFLFAPHSMHPFLAVVCPEKKKSAQMYGIVSKIHLRLIIIS